MSESEHKFQALQIEVDRLQKEVTRLQAREEYQEQIERELSSTLENLTIHQEELRTQNEELRQVQENLEESSRRYRDLFDQAPVGYFIIDEHGLIQQANKKGAELLGYGCEYLSGKPFLLYLTHEARKMFSAHLRKFSVKIRSSSTEVECVHTSGKTIPLRLESVLIHEPSSTKKLFRTTVVDISDRKKAEAILIHTERQLRQAFKMEAIGTLAGGIAHDFNNILAAMLGNLELARSNLPSGSPIHRYLDEVLTAGFRAKDLVRQILAFSRQTEPTKQLLDPKHLIQESIQLLQATLPKTIRIETHLVEKESLWVLADPTELHQVIINLCTNAEYAMRETGGCLTIQMSRIEVSSEFAKAHPPLKPVPHVYLTVQDTGSGILAKVQSRIFDPFFSTKELGEGTGMGLSVAHGIVTHHKGIIILEESSPKGSRFGVYLPLKNKPTTKPVQTPPPLAPRIPGRILLIDDEEPLARMGVEMLQRLGYNAVACTSGSEGLALFEANPESFDVVVVDQTMPKITGEDFARRVLSLKPEMPVILCTGFSHVMTPERAQAVGITAFLMKPLLSHELDQVIQEQLSRSHGTRHS